MTFFCTRLSKYHFDFDHTTPVEDITDAIYKCVNTSYFKLDKHSKGYMEINAAFGDEIWKLNPSVEAYEEGSRVLSAWLAHGRYIDP